MTNHKEQSKVGVIIGSPSQDFPAAILKVLEGYDPYQFTILETASAILEAPADLYPSLALIDGRYGTEVANEWTQSTKMTFPEIRIIVLHNGKDLLDFASVKKNGADEIMHLNYDREFIADIVLTLAPIDFQGKIPVSALLSVDTRDLVEDTELNFDLYLHLPSNHKTIKYKKEGSKLEKKTLNRFANAQQNMYITKTQTKNFFEYARTTASMRDMETPVSQTEKLNKSKKTIYTIMAEFMNGSAGDYQEGKLILAKCKEILQEFQLTQDYPGKLLTKELSRFTGMARTYYTDAINLAAIAAFFAQALEYSPLQREDAALAGLLHNIGLAQMPTETFGKSSQQLTPDELAEYHLYPERSVNMVKGKKVPLSSEVSDGIIMHRETGDGKGFPKNLYLDKMTDLGKLMSLAYVFLELTSLKEKSPSHTIENALQYIKDEALTGKSHFDILMVTRLFKRLHF